ncbi:hypothetical protein DVW83_13750, partial [Enterococcus sp. VV15]
IVIPPAIFFYYSTLFDSRFKTLQQNRDSNCPSLSELKALQGADIQILGKTQITMVLFQNKNLAVLSPES